MTHHLNPEERRKYPRSKRGLHLPIEVDGPGILNHVDNISANGLLCHTVQPVPVMTRLQIAIELPKPFNHRITAEGIVVRCDRDELGDDKFKVGIVFTKIDERDQEKIQEFVQHTLSEKK